MKWIVRGDTKNNQTLAPLSAGKSKYHSLTGIQANLK
jgi:hypothetical protein